MTAYTFLSNRSVRLGLGSWFHICARAGTLLPRTMTTTITVAAGWCCRFVMLPDLLIKAC